MVREMLIDTHGIGHAIAIRENGKLKDLFLDPKESRIFYPPSCFILVKILRRVKERGAYFIKLPNNKEGFLVSKKIYSQGEKIIAMAKIYNENEKLQKFSDKLKIETKYLIIEKGNGGIFFSKMFKDTNLKKNIKELLKEKINVSGQPVSIIVRSSASILDNINWNEIIDFSLNQWKRLVGNFDKDEPFFLSMLSKEKAFSIYGLESRLSVIEREGIFELQGIWDEIQNLQSKKYIFGKKSYLIIEQTAAFCAIDVNSGSDLEIKTDKINKDACESIAYNIRLRGLGGKIIIDFLPASKKSRVEIEEKIKTHFQSLRGNFRVLGWTKGNNFEIEGTRDEIPLNLIMDS